PGSLFIQPAAAQPGADTSNGAANAIDFSRTMTGRLSGADYDVVPMQIWMDIDPAAVIRFEEELYKTNMGHTVINSRFKTVNPVDRATNGYIYGPSQCIEIEI